LTCFKKFGIVLEKFEVKEVKFMSENVSREKIVKELEELKERLTNVNSGYSSKNITSTRTSIILKMYELYEKLNGEEVVIAGIGDIVTYTDEFGETKLKLVVENGNPINGTITPDSMIGSKLFGHGVGQYGYNNNNQALIISISDIEKGSSKTLK
jgi:transcription elongation GreA/GreB family factor